MIRKVNEFSLKQVLTLGDTLVRIIKFPTQTSVCLRNIGEELTWRNMKISIFKLRKQVQVEKVRRHKEYILYGKLP